jgi:RNA polymerase sigma factor (sigma-70 family)
MEQEALIPHLFRTEYSKIVVVLCKRFGFDQMEIAEDIASDTFLAAAQTWPMHGIPSHPVAWLYHVAKNKARNWLQREAVFRHKVSPALRAEGLGASGGSGDFGGSGASGMPAGAGASGVSGFSGQDEQDIDLSPKNIEDSQLQMMFAICTPVISPEAQIGLSLRILCGFGIEEIADAFLSNKETINKRLFRAKEKLREEKVSLQTPGVREIDERLSTVLTTIYLLFSEGYYSLSQDTTLRKDLCFEAMRLCRMLIENPLTNKPEVNALLSLMCFHASRFEARVGQQGEMVLYDDQDTALWDEELISQGGYYLHRSAHGPFLSRYHLEASIAYWHCIKEDTAEKWETILQLYNRLLQMEYSPIAALNRTFALAKANGKQAAIAEAEKLMLTDNHFYYTLLGELYTGIDNKKAVAHFLLALSLAKTATDKRIIQQKIDRL